MKTGYKNNIAGFCFQKKSTTFAPALVLVLDVSGIKLKGKQV